MKNRTELEILKVEAIQKPRISERSLKYLITLVFFRPRGLAQFMRGLWSNSHALICRLKAKFCIYMYILSFFQLCAFWGLLIMYTKFSEKNKLQGVCLQLSVFRDGF